MLRIQDHYNKEDFFDFKLINVEYKNNVWVYALGNNKNDLRLDFTLPYEIDSFHDGNSVSVYLLKNKFFAQSHICEVRVEEYNNDKGRIGYIVQLNSIFEPTILTVNKHLFSYLYYSLGNIFYNQDFKQTKTPELSKTTFDITDFFDDDILVLMLFDQAIGQIPSFRIETYLPSLYKFGFYLYHPTRGGSFENTSNEILANYQGLQNNTNTSGYRTMKLSNISSEIISDNFFSKIFENHLLQKNDEETRFLILYQVIEILIFKILTLELKKKVCSPGNTLEAFKLKKAIDEELSEANRITHLFHSYSALDNSLKETLKRELYILLNLVGFEDYQDAFNPTNVHLHIIFYDYRNRMVHNHRSFKADTLDETVIRGKMNTINSLTELLVIDIITTYRV